ncbi:hypothetical protein SM124_06405 [Bacillus sp. 31A1R]|uniref:Uncharacterized protein n=1 Tax=Robertmurraya mangrovi TaxID=3098077 RepID=A0ABU5IW63_9BACI|nr:hypothetical protein [Bacillus sp. 31A1R]MDZ5471375.1 hypothetical protein [Bacillus sp. 31A1R]
MKKKGTYILIILLLPLIFFTVDFSLAKNNKPPIFAIKTAMYKDGGTKAYQGLGYKVVDYNQMDGRKDVVFISPFINWGEPE